MDAVDPEDDVEAPDFGTDEPIPYLISTAGWASLETDSD